MTNTAVEPDRLTVVAALRRALSRVTVEDAHLVEGGVNERSVTHRLAIYLAAEFDDSWDVDIEYNRNLDTVKRLGLHRRDVTDYDLHATTVFPDVIVHRRGTSTNLLVIEAKRNAGGHEYDFEKLQAFTRSGDGGLGYRFGAHVVIGKRTIQWFENGESVGEPESPEP